MYNQINVQNIKNYFRKPTTLVLAIALAVPVIISAILSMLTLAEVNSILQHFNQFIRDNTGEYPSSISILGSIPTVIITCIVSLIPAGLWLWVYLSSRSNDINKKPDTPFLINFIFSILGIVGSAITIIISGLLFIAAIGLTAYSNESTYSIDSSEQELFNFFVGLFFILAVVIFFVGAIRLIYNIAKTKFFGSVRKSMTAERMYPSGGLYGVLSIIYAIFTFFGCISCIIFGFSLLGNEGYITGTDSVHDMFTMISNFKSLAVLLIISGFAGFISTFAQVLEGIVAIGYGKMAKTVPHTPNFNPYGNNGYPQYNQFNQNQYNPNFNNYNNQNYNNANYNNQYYNNQPYQNNQGYVNQQPNVQQTAVPTESTNNDYNDGFDELNKHLDNQINNEANLNTNPYENK